MRLDPTSGKLMRLCYKEGYRHILICNLFSFRTPDIEKLILGDETENDKIIKENLDKFDKIICGWGEGKGIDRQKYRERIDRVKTYLLNKKTFKIGHTLVKNLYPKHPRSKILINDKLTEYILK
jgi:hypothetical protein